MRHSRHLRSLFLVLACCLAVASAETVPRRALLVDKEVAIAVDPIGVVRSTSISTSISLNFFCEFVKPLLDFDLPSGYC